MVHYNEYVPYTFRSSFALLIAGLATPAILSFAGGININALFMFEAVMYVAYYALVFLFFKDEIGLEMGLLPTVVFFDFVLNAAWLGSFGSALNGLMVNGFGSGTAFIVFSGVILGFVALGRKAGEIGDYVSSVINKIKGNREKNLTEGQILLKKIDSEGMNWGGCEMCNRISNDILRKRNARSPEHVHSRFPWLRAEQERQSKAAAFSN